MSFLDRLLGYNELNHHAIALDVGTEFVKTLVFRVDQGKAYILGASRTRQELKDMQGGAITDISGVIKNCLKSLEEACDMAKITPDKVIMGIAGELVKGATTTISYTRKEPAKKIDAKELDNIIKKVQEKAFGQIHHQIAWETGKDDIDIHLVNAAIADVKIDRHPVSSPIGFTGKNIVVSVYNAFSPMIYLGALESVAENLGLNLIGIAAEPYAVAKSMGLSQGQDFSAIFMDIGGGTTDIAVVRGGGLEGTKIFSIGGRAFTKRIAREMNTNFAKAEEMKLAYANNDLAEKEKQAVGEILQEDVSIWLEGVKMVLKEFGDEQMLPSRILLCGGGSLLPEIKKSLEKSDWAKDLAFAKKANITFIKPKDVENVIDQTKLLDSPSDITAMALANLAIELVEGLSPMAEMLRKTAEGITH
ncbi:rod shape-determining protein [Candidatus Microgenomates bacterium]|nr:rod shape-determining protein [Candidatus Microgenomates bacterium]